MRSGPLHLKLFLLSIAWAAAALPAYADPPKTEIHVNVSKVDAHVGPQKGEVHPPTPKSEIRAGVPKAEIHAPPRTEVRAPAPKIAVHAATPPDTHRTSPPSKTVGDVRATEAKGKETKVAADVPRYLSTETAAQARALVFEQVPKYYQARASFFSGDRHLQPLNNPEIEPTADPDVVIASGRVGPPGGLWGGTYRTYKVEVNVRTRLIKPVAELGPPRGDYSF